MSVTTSTSPLELNAVSALSHDSWENFDALVHLLGNSRHLVVLSGAGCSTESGIPDYRDRAGSWKRTPPMKYQEFIGSQIARQRYWARALIGWRQFHQVRPNRAHGVLAEWERAGWLQQLITQNVDGLHHRAGSRKVIDLHGRIDTVECLQCEHTLSREWVQRQLIDLNPSWSTLNAVMAPDGDALLADVDFSTFRLRECPHCNGVLKPAVVFFGESVPRHKVANAFAAVDDADAMLIVGSSLMVFSGYRFVRRANERGIPVALINQGRTRADHEVHVKVEGRCSEVLQALVPRLL